MSILSFNLENNVFVVTGGSRGIGLEIAKMLLDQKAKVVICGRKIEGLDSAADSLNAGESLKTTRSARTDAKAAKVRMSTNYFRQPSMHSVLSMGWSTMSA